MAQNSVSPAAAGMRGQVLLRLLYTLLFWLLLGVTLFLVSLCLAVQFALALITLKPSEPVRRVGNQLAVYAYRLVRYITLNENTRPFPFSEFPQVLEPGEEEVRFE